MDGKIRRHFYVDGRVQGVGFRYTARYVASSMGVTGWVKNLDDGRVELEVQGDRELVIHFLERVQNAGRWIRIDRIEEQELPLIEEENRFYTV